MSRRFRPPRRSGYVWLVVLVLVIIARFWGGPAGQQPHASRHESLPAGQHHVVRVVDGDTLLVDPHARVRLIGVNAPETVKPDWPVEPWVRLEFDDEPLDAYDRYLAYVYVGDRMLNEELARAGLARFEPNFHYSSAMKRRFRQAQDEAKRKHLVIWSGHDASDDGRRPAPSAHPNHVFSGESQ